MTREWTKHGDYPGALLLVGYPIRVEEAAPPYSPFRLIFRDHSLPYHTLEAAQMDGEQRADEMDKFAARQSAD